MIKIFLMLFILILLPISFTKAQSADWYFPIGDYVNREQYKTFGQYFDKNFYIGKESLFPAQYTGYHAAADLEIFSGEENKDVPVYAIADGKISFIGPVGGYGGVILLDLANDSHTALYGHLKLSSFTLKAGDSVQAGQFLANLGRAFSNETGNERKHLHFGIYNGKGAYFKGYENSDQAIRSKWVDPGAYLRDKGAADADQQTPAPNAREENVIQESNINDNVSDILTTQNTQNLSIKSENKGIWDIIKDYLEKFFSSF